MGVQIDKPYLAYVEDLVKAKVCHKFGKIEAEAKAKSQHRRDVISWSKRADQAMFRQKVYEYRRAWTKKVVDAGLASEAEAVALARINFPLE